MSLRLKPLHPVFAAEASGIDLTQPISIDEAKAINAAMNEHAVLVFRGQPLTAEQQMTFATSFGPLDIGLKRVFKRPERLGDERLIDISNVDATGHVARRDSPKNLSNFANQLWHSDSSFMNPRAAYSMLHAVITPSWGGNTEFADLRAAWDTLDERTRRDVEGLSAEHYALHTRLLLGDEATPTIRRRRSIRPSGRSVDTHPGLGPQAAVRRRACAPHPRLADRRKGRMFLGRPARACDAARARLRARMATRRPRDLGQPQHAAPRPALRHRRAARAAADDDQRDAGSDARRGSDGVPGLTARTCSAPSRRYSGMFPCLRHGSSTFLSRSITSERQMRLRVSCGWITSSM
jgi:alpha-ketoglutarate-dependent 2,4-dichlorophenoxyacetate dioxygenase